MLFHRALLLWISVFLFCPPTTSMKPAIGGLVFDFTIVGESTFDIISGTPAVTGNIQGTVCLDDDRNRQRPMLLHITQAPSELGFDNFDENLVSSQFSYDVFADGGGFEVAAGVIVAASNLEITFEETDGDFFELNFNNERNSLSGVNGIPGRHERIRQHERIQRIDILSRLWILRIRSAGTLIVSNVWPDLDGTGGGQIRKKRLDRPPAHGSLKVPGRAPQSNRRFGICSNSRY